MKWVYLVLGIVLAAVGVVWILQGTDVLRAGYMAGHMQYAYLGIVAVIAGAALLALGSRRARPASSTAKNDRR
jgi:hypothetical protein